MCLRQTGLQRQARKGRAARGLKSVGLAALVQGGRSRGMDRYAHKAGKEIELVGNVEVRALCGCGAAWAGWLAGWLREACWLGNERARVADIMMGVGVCSPRMCCNVIVAGC